MMYSLGSKNNMAAIFLLLTVLATKIVHAVDVFESSENAIKHMVVDPATGQLVVGAVNKLYRLLPDLSLVENVTTGPKLDNIKCTAFDEDKEKCVNPNDEDLSPTNNVNKLLVLDTDNRRVLTCGTYFQGVCEFRNIANLSNSTTYYGNVNEHALAPNVAGDRFSAVAFIGPGPRCGSKVYDGPNLYVGRSNTNSFIDNSALRQHLPAYSSHRLQGDVLDDVYFTALSDSGTYRDLRNSDYFETDKHVIQYISGFSHKGYSYFFTIESDSSDMYETKLVRICQNDCLYRSYVEIVVSCVSDSIDYNLVQSSTLVKPGQKLADQLGIEGDDEILVTTFSNSSSSESYQADNYGAVCIFTFKELNDSFVDNLKNCYSGKGHVAKKFYETGFDTKCSQINTVSITDSFCANEDEEEVRNVAVSGTQLLSRSAALVTPVRLTSVVVDVIAQYTVAFFGTHTGTLKKVELEGHVKAREYAEVVVEKGVEILRDSSISQDRSKVYVMTAHKIHSVPIVPGENSDCSGASTCEECRDLGDPYCGWCSLEKKCSPRSQCENYGQSKRWLSYVAWECLELDSVDPDRASITKSISVKINIEELPPTTAESQYQCVFGGSQYTEEAEQQGNDLTCHTPNQPPSIEDGEDNVQVTLFIKSTQTGVHFLQEYFDFYDCQVHTSCSTCASARWDCHWCLYDNRCSDSSTCEHEGKTVANAAECPAIRPTDNYFIPVDVQKELIIPGSFLPEPVEGGQGYQCVFYVEGERVAVPATRLDDSTVKCQSFQYSYSSAIGELSPAVEVQWNDNFVVENKSKIHVTLYKCHILGQDCSQCLGLINTLPKYNCRFCASRCSYGTTCVAPVDTSCPDPVITSVGPLSGPVDGGTVVTIRGENLGTRYSDIQGGVSLGTHKCEVMEDKYNVSTKIECLTGSVAAPQNVTVRVTVKRGDDSITASYSTHLFQYKNPQLLGLSPTYGPLAGGTLVTVRGRHLQTGETDKTLVTFGNTRCMLQTPVEDDRLTCITKACDDCTSNQPHAISVTFDGALRQISSRYVFRANPVINSITPTKVFLAGGREITVKGTNLNAVQKPLMYITVEEQRYFGNCSASENGTSMICDSPQLKAPPSTKRARRQSPGSYPVGFQMDGVQSVQELGDSFNVTSTFDVVPDPEYETFENGKAVFKPDTQLLLKGRNLNLACTISEVTVHIGEDVCVVRTLDSNNLYCDPPTEQPAGSGAGSLPLVVVEVGQLRTEVGSLEYAADSSPRDAVWIIGVGVGGGFLLTLIIIILVVYVRKSTQADRQYKKLKMQLDTLESNVRNECKQAFAELQTEVSDFTSDISVIGIPMWDYKTYTFKVLFPSHSDHPVLHNGPEYMTNKFGGYDQGLHQFSQLLNSKHFMLIFIRTLEQQKNFSIRDKAVVASLLMIVLQDKMEYATEILKALMNELIDKSVEKKHPKLMLRRTESVVEKLLTNWLSVCMYSYLKKHAGKELFMLYQAITRQTEKGPVDAIHSEARYSLSEDRLLREKIEPKTLNINLVTDGEREPVTCRCLDCDTVTQAKQKALNAIYLNTPFSSRPSVYDVDLEWRSGKSGHLPLQDEDVTTEVVGGWKKVNTLAHYHVPDGAVMALVEKRTKSDGGVRMVHGRIEITAGSNSTIAPIVTIEEGQKVWHLVKHDDGLYVSRNPKVISEIFLTRLLATKGTLQQYIDELFLAILRVDSSLPPAIKWLFDFLDTAAKRHSIYDPDVVHTWKSNSLPLRFWVNIIKNPEFVFDIHKSHITDSCLSVIAQTFMDSCSTMEHRLGKDSPSNKLLFAKDIPRFRSMVSKFYKGIQEQPPVTDQDMNQIMTEMSLNFLLKHYTADFNVSIALKELFKYAHQYNFELLEALDEDASARKFHLANKFEEVTANLEGSNY